MLLPHKKELIGFLPLSELYTVHSDHERLRVFAKKGRECVACGRVGTLLALGRETNLHRDSRRKKTVGKVHLDLYTDDFVLMTVDHIVPKAICREMGWSASDMESLDNKQPMCDPCNASKGHNLILPDEMRRRRANSAFQPSTKVYGTELVRGLVPNIHALLGNSV